VLSINGRFELDKQVVFTPLDSSEAVLLHLDTKAFYTLNETASRVWQLLSTGHSPSQIADALAAEFDVEPERAQADVVSVCGELQAERLIRPTA
jgi:hypothetical protein